MFIFKNFRLCIFKHAILRCVQNMIKKKQTKKSQKISHFKPNRALVFCRFINRDLVECLFNPLKQINFKIAK